MGTCVGGGLCYSVAVMGYKDFTVGAHTSEPLDLLWTIPKPVIDIPTRRLMGLSNH